MPRIDRSVKLLYSKEYRHSKSSKQRHKGEKRVQLKHLEYLIRAAECGSITQAAEQLFVSQPSITKAIMSLEQEYQVKLVIRKPRGIDLTPEGRRFIHYAQGVLTAAAALRRNCTAPDEPQRRLFLAAQPLDFIYPLLLTVYDEVQAQNMHFNLIETNRNDVVQQVLNRQADIGVLVRSRADAKNFLWNTEAKRLDLCLLDSTPPCVCVGPHSPYYNRHTITYAEAEHCTALALSMESQAAHDLYFDNTDPHFNTERIIFVNTVSACQHLLLHTDALAFLSKWTVGCLSDPSLHILQIAPSKNDKIPHINDLLWIRRAGESLTPTEQQFIRHLYAHLGKPVPTPLL